MKCKHEITGAIMAWSLAIREKLGKPHPSEDSFESLAKQYCRGVCSVETLLEVGDLFDWDAIDKLMEEYPLEVPDEQT